MRSVTVSVLVVMCFAAAALSGCKRKSPEHTAGSHPSGGGVSDKSVVLAQLSPGDAVADRQYLFAAHGGGVAWIDAEGDGHRVVHNGRKGKRYEAIGNVVLSADGGRCAYGARASGTWRIVVDGGEGRTFDEVGLPVFSPDGAHVAYEARTGSAWHLVVDDVVSAGAAARTVWKDFGADSSRIVFLDRSDEQGPGRLVVSDVALGKQTVLETRVARAGISPDRTTLAAVVERDAQQQVMTFRIASPEPLARGRTYDVVHSVAFSADGSSVAYFAERGGTFFVGLDDRDEEVDPGESIVELPAVSAEQRRVAVALVVPGGVRVREFFRQGVGPGTVYGGVEALTYAKGGGSLAYVADRDGKYLVVANGSEGPAFDRAVTPTFSPDGKFLVYRARNEGKRFVVVADPNGKTIRQHPAYEQVFPVQFTADGKSVAYGVKDGRQLAWKVEPL